MVMMAWVMILFGAVIIFSESKHLMMVLLGVEVMSVGLYGLLSWAVLSIGLSSLLCLVFLTFAVCEAVLGLSALVSCVRGFGTEKVQSCFLVKY